MKTLPILSLLLTISLGTFALNPSRTYKQLPEKYNMVYTAHEVTTDDGAKLKAWHFPKKGEASTELILICHNGEGNMADYLRRVDQFRADFNVVIFDYRGYGESSEFEIDNNMYIYPHFQEDLKAMFDFCRKQFVAKFNIYGWGIGAGLAMGVGYNRAEAKKIIADTPFLSMEDLEERFSNWDEPMEVPFAGYDKKNEPTFSLDNSPANPDLKIKLFIGSNDILFTPADMEALQAKQKKLIDKVIYIIENPDRKDNFDVDKAAYYGECKAFLQG